MYDPYVTQNLLVKDITCHRAGLANEAGTRFQRLGYKRDQVYRAISCIKPVYPFRAGYEYNDVMFQIAARIIVAVTGKSYEVNLKERIFEPLGSLYMYVFRNNICNNCCEFTAHLLTCVLSKHSNVWRQRECEGNDVPVLDKVLL